MKTFTEYSRATLLFVCLLGFGLITSAKVQAADSAMYFDFDRLGEGITLMRSEDRILFTYFTYADGGNCQGIDVPNTSIASNADCTQSRWYFGTDTINDDDDEVIGLFYMGVGADFETGGVPNSQNLFGTILGDNLLIGLFTLERFIDGWKLSIFRIGNALPEDAHVYGVHEFPDRLFSGQD